MTITNNTINAFENMQFQFQLTRIPNCNFFARSATIPSISIGTANFPTPYTNLPIPGDHAVFAPFSLTFRVDEDFQNRIEIQKWMEKLSFPDNRGQYGDRNYRSKTTPNGENSDTSDGTLILFTSKNNPSIEIRFEEMWPSDVGEINIDIDQSGTIYMDCNVTFQYTKYTIARLK